MTAIEKCLDLDLAPTRRTPVMRLLDVLSLPLTLLRTLRNRREIGSLEHFSDHELADIGLTRGDLRAAFGEGRFTDPSPYLTQVARHRRPTIRRKTL